jgi:thiol-disulfide isomerase/thioredoxin/DNA-binding beta-propeller fold protein YncE
MMRWLFAFMLLAAVPAHAEDKPFPITETQRAVVSQPVWLNTSRALTADDLRGRIVLLDFWTLGCINCIDIIPDLKALEHEFGDKLTVIGVHSAKFANEKDTENIRNAIVRYGLVHPVVNDSDFIIWNKFGVRAWPTLALITPAGTVSNVYAGEGNRAALETDIRTLIDKYNGKIVTAPLPLALESAKLAQTTLRFPGKVITGMWAAKEKEAAPALYVADSGHNRIAVMDTSGALLQSIGSGTEGLKDGSFAEAEFFKPQGMAYAQKDDKLYVADLGNHALRLVDLKKQTVTTLAGTGVQGRALDAAGEKDALKTPLTSPWDVTFYPDDKHLVIAMAGAHQLWSYDIAARTVSLVAGNGQESIDDGQYPFNSLSQPSGLFAAGDKLYFTDAESSSLRVIDKGGNVATLIGKGLFDFGYKEGGKSEALLQHCLGLTGTADNLYIADTYNHSIRRYDLKTGTLHNYAGHDARGSADGALADASFNEPGGIAIAGDTLYVADTNNHALRAIDMKAGKVSTLGSAPAPAVAMPAAATGPGPNLATLAFTVAAGVPIEMALDLKPGWHVNDQAPSELSLSRGDALLMGFSRDMLKAKHVTLPKLKKGGVYHLKGTIYFCEEQAGSLCMIKSFDVTLTPKGKDTKITLPVY